MAVRASSTGFGRVAQRAVVAIGIGTVCGLLSYAVALQLSNGSNDVQDFWPWWKSARALLAHQDPYIVACRQVGNVCLQPYPLTAAFAAMPFAGLPLHVAGPLFVGVECLIFAFVLTATSWTPLLVFSSGCMLLTILSAQSAPLLAAGVVAPWLTWVGVFKPNIGLAMLAYRPSLRIVTAMAAIVAISVIMYPQWPAEWISGARQSPYHFAIWQTPGGIALAFALLRWRRPEARLLAAMSFFPTSPLVYEALPLVAVLKTRREFLIFGLLTNVAWSLTIGRSTLDADTFFAWSRPAMLWLVYMPCLAMVLRRPNTGLLPDWAEAVSARLPRWLRGESGSRAT